MNLLSQETNTRLYHVQSVINCADASDSPKERLGLEYMAWLGLQSAWYAWMTELANQGARSASNPRSLDDLLRSDFRQDSGVQHLINLKASPDSWLSTLLARVGEGDVQACRQDSGPATQAAKGVGELSLKDVSAETEIECLQRVLLGFKDYIQFTREHRQEW